MDHSARIRAAGHPYPELREIALDQRRDIAGEPKRTRLIVRQFIDGRQSAPEPALRPRTERCEFGSRESAQLQDSEASGERLGGNPQERRCGRPEQHQPSRCTALVDDVADHREQIGSALHFVDADRTGMVAEEQFRIASDQGSVRRALKVVVRMAAKLMANEGALADLARSDDEYHREGGEKGSQPMGQRAGGRSSYLVNRRVDYQIARYGGRVRQQKRGRRRQKGQSTRAW